MDKQKRNVIVTLIPNLILMHQNISDNDKRISQ